MSRVLFATFAAVGISLVALRIAAPWPLDGQAIERAMVAVSVQSIAEWNANPGTVYVSFDGRDPMPDHMRELKRRTGIVNVQPMSQRSTSEDQCKSGDPVLIVVGQCKKNDFLSVFLLAMPLWHTAHIATATSACGTEQVLVQVLNEWIIISTRRLCT